jgi:hypothetical protein
LQFGFENQLKVDEIDGFNTIGKSGGGDKNKVE